MVRSGICSIAAACAATALTAAFAYPAHADEAQVQRGKYLVTIAGCSDCHTPGALIGKTDMARYLGGSDVGFAIPGLGVYYGQNLTPDKATGLGDWSNDQIVAAIRTGKRPDGGMLFPVMPYPALAHLTDEDAQAIVAFLKSLPAVTNKVPGPLGPKDNPAGLLSVIIPADKYPAVQ